MHESMLMLDVDIDVTPCVDGLKEQTIKVDRFTTIKVQTIISWLGIILVVMVHQLLETKPSSGCIRSMDQVCVEDPFKRLDDPFTRLDDPFKRLQG